MARRRLPFSVVKRPGSPFWYYKLGAWKSYKSTGKKLKSDAIKVAMEALEEHEADPSGPTLRKYAGFFFVWGKCPHVRRLLSEGKSITRYHVRDMRRIMENHLFADPLAELRIAAIKRADILDYRERLIEKLGYTRTVQKAVSVVKTILKEAYFREDLNRDPNAGIGITRYQATEIGTFTEEELQKLFPPEPPGPWRDIYDYAVFLTAAATGMRRGEILALTWECIHFDEQYIEVRQAWKDRHEMGLPKWNKTRTVPLPEKLAKTLKTIRKRRHYIGEDDLIFCYEDGNRFGGTWWAKRFAAAMEAAGIDRKTRNIRPHSFRHTLNSLLREKGYDPEKIRAALGWADEQIQENYTHWNAGSFDGHREIVDGFFRK